MHGPILFADRSENQRCARSKPCARELLQRFNSCKKLNQLERMHPYRPVALIRHRAEPRQQSFRRLTTSGDFGSPCTHRSGTIAPLETHSSEWSPPNSLRTPAHGDRIRRSTATRAYAARGRFTIVSPMETTERACSRFGQQISVSPLDHRPPIGCARA